MSSGKILLGNDSLWDLEPSTENPNSMTAFSLEELTGEHAPLTQYTNSTTKHETENVLQSENGSPERGTFRAHPRKEIRNPSIQRGLKFLLNDDDDDDDDDDDYFISLSKLRSMQQSPIFHDKPIEPEFAVAQGKSKPIQKISPKEEGNRLPSLSQVGATLLYEANLRMKRTLSQHCFELLYSRRNTISLRKFWSSWNQLVIKKNVLDRDIGRLVGRIEIKLTEEAFVFWKRLIILNKSLVQKQRIINQLAAFKSVQTSVLIWKQRLNQKRKFESIERFKQSRSITSTFCEWVEITMQNIERLKGIKSFNARLQIKILRSVFFSIVQVIRSRKHLELLSSNLARANSTTCHHAYAKWISLLRYNQRLEQIARLTAGRWNALNTKLAFSEWFECWIFSRQCHRKYVMIVCRGRRTCIEKLLTSWILLFERSKLLQMNLAKKYSRQNFQFLSHVWRKIFQYLGILRHFRSCYMKLQRMRVHDSKTLFLDAWILYKQKCIAVFKANQKQAFHDFRRRKQVFDVWQQSWNKASQLQQFMGILRKSMFGTLLKEHFQSWYHLSVYYWISWRKAEKMSNRITSTLVFVYFASWRVRIRVRNRVIDFLYKIQRRSAISCFQAWWECADHEISKRGRTEEGISRMDARRCYKQLERHLEFWYEKMCARGRIRNMQQIKERLYHRRLSMRMMMSWSSYIAKYRLLAKRLQWLNHKVSYRLLQGTFANFNLWRRFSRKSEHIILFKSQDRFQKLFRFCWSSWMEICRLNLVRNRKYNLMVERDDSKSYSTVFLAWSQKTYLKTTLKNRLNNFTKHTVELRLATMYFSSWRTKHRNTRKFLQFARRRLLAQLERTYEEFYSAVKHLHFKKYHLSSILHRVDSRVKCTFFNMWHARKECSLQQKVEATEMKRRSDLDCMSKSFHALSSKIKKLILYQQGQAYLQDLHKKSLSRKCFAQMSGIARLRTDYGIVLDLVQSRRCEQRKYSFLGLWADFATQQKVINGRANTLLNRNIRILLEQAYSAMKHTLVLSYSIKQIKDRGGRKLLDEFFMQMLSYAKLSCEERRKLLHATKKYSSTCCKSYLLGWHIIVIASRQMETRLEKLYSRTVLKLTAAMFQCWQAFVVQAKKFLRHLISRRHIALQLCLATWQGLFDENESNACKIMLMTRRHRSRFKHHVYRRWDEFSALQRNRRISMLRIWHRSNMVTVRKMFRLFIAGCKVSRRSKMLQAKAESKVKHDKIVAVTRFLQKIALSKKRYRRNIERVRRRHALTLIKDAWTSWHAKMATTSRMHQVLSKAIDLNRH